MVGTYQYSHPNGSYCFLFAKLGQWLDHKFPNEHTVYVKILTIVGVALAFYNINRQLKEISKLDENQ